MDTPKERAVPGIPAGNGLFLFGGKLNPKLSIIGKTIFHAAVGGATAAAAPYANDFLGALIPAMHLSGPAAFIVGSTISSIFSAFSTPPHKEE